jgi:competence protein ComGC
MKRVQSGPQTTGFTLVEVLVCCLIIDLLLGLVMVSAAPARERARETACLSNLHQIGRAIQMYRQDYGGGEPPAATSREQLGLPPHPSRLLSYLGGNRGVFLCPDEEDPPGRVVGPVDGLRVSYMWCPYAPEGLYNGFPSFTTQVERRGEDTPVVVDLFHRGATYGEYSTRPWLGKYIILRLDGRVEDRLVDREAVGASWKL